MGKKNGAKPKLYPTEMVAEVERLYLLGHTQEEVGSFLGLTQKVIWRLMWNHGIKARPAIKRDQWGENNDSWKDKDATYTAFHLRVAEARGKPKKCEHCGTTKSKRFEWASLNKKYWDVMDYIRLCGPCHHKMDGTIRNIHDAISKKKGGA